MLCKLVQKKVCYGNVSIIDLQLLSSVYLLKYISLTEKYHGVVLLPEGLIESIPEVYGLLKVIKGMFLFLFFLSLNSLSASVLYQFTSISFRKSIDFFDKVFPLIKYHHNCHLGHLHYFTFCHHLLEKSFFFIQNQMTQHNCHRQKQKSFLLYLQKQK